MTLVGQSTRHKLQHQARQTKRRFDEVLQYFAMERFLYRLSRSPYADRFILKGGLMLSVWGGSLSRPTMDIDLLAHNTPNTIDNLVTVVRQLCDQETEPDDGLEFAAASTTGSLITKDAGYSGVRVQFDARLDTARIKMQIDVGFGDDVYPSPTMVLMPVILPLPAPSLYGYSKESAIAEKLQAMIKLGQFNSRLKDFFDIWFLSQTHEFDGETLKVAIQRTCDRRATVASLHPLALSPAFLADGTKQAQWSGFLRKSHIAIAPASLATLQEKLREFIHPALQAIDAHGPFPQFWRASGPWAPGALGK